jgi:hypothetical protein
MTAPTRSTSDRKLVKVAYAQDQTEAECSKACYTMRMWLGRPSRARLRCAGVPCTPVRVTCSSAASELPTSRKTSCARVTRMRRGHRRGPAPIGRRGCSPGC